jgi:hypothetical protein
MKNRDNIFTEQLRSYALLYVKVGEIELAFREVIPTTFSSSETTKDLNWLNFLHLKLGYQSTFVRFNRGRENQVHHLPFSFWTSLFSIHNYRKLWIPYLSHAFPNLSNPRSRKSFLEINRLLFESRGIRNRVAHFDFPGDIDFAKDSQSLDELLRLLGRTD